MLDFKQLSFWEKQQVTEGIDFLIVGSGIVGTSCALKLRSAYPDARIVLVERGYLPSGASTKNAGFACFGSVTELLDDLKTIPETDVWDTVYQRYQGLKQLLERFPAAAIDYKQCGSYDLIDSDKDHTEFQEKIAYLNSKIHEISGVTECYSWKEDFIHKYHFNGFKGGFYNQLEGSIDTGKLWLATFQLLAKNNIILLNGIEINQLESFENEVLLQTNFGELKAKHVCVATNGLSQKILPAIDLKPARAQVIVTSEIPNLRFHETFHFQSGYYYFRTVGKRILFGGGRNLDMLGETTTEFGNTELIQQSLTSLLKEKIIPNTPFNLDYTWSGIMGVGSLKKPIVKKIAPNIAIGVRLGGMGVAIGTETGAAIADLFL
jgi:glycine/D-amino acid oxidase-like deaminating enzyme